MSVLFVASHHFCKVCRGGRVCTEAEVPPSTPRSVCVKGSPVQFTDTVGALDPEPDPVKYAETLRMRIHWKYFGGFVPPPEFCGIPLVRSNGVKGLMAPGVYTYLTVVFTLAPTGGGSVGPDVLVLENFSSPVTSLFFGFPLGPRFAVLFRCRRSIVVYMMMRMMMGERHGI